MVRTSIKIAPACALLCAALSGCSVRGMATKALADTFASSGTGYAADDDPELVEAAVPFALKTMEQVAVDQPRHVGLHTALASGFTEYGYAFVQQRADELSESDVEKSRPVVARARKIFLRARDWGLRGLEITHPGFRGQVMGKEPERKAAIAALTKEDVPLVYWTAAAWTLAISDGKDQMDLVSQLPWVEELMARAFTLDESWGDGAIEEYYVAYDGSRSAEEGGGAKRARQHLERALALGGNKKLGPLVSYAETVCVQAQDKKEFERLLQQVAAADVDKYPEVRLANVVAQRRARWLLSRTADLFAE